MKTITRFSLLVTWLIALGGAHAENIAVMGATIYTMAGAPLKDGVVLMRDGKITALGPKVSVKIPEGYRILQAAVVTPGLIDAHATVGLSGLLNQAQDQDMLEKAYEAVGAKYEDVNHGDMRSQELESTNKSSPVAPRKKNKYGV